MLYKVSAFLGWMIRLRSCQSGAIILVDCFGFMQHSGRRKYKYMRIGKKFLQWFNNQKLGNKIKYTFLVASVVPLLRHRF